MTGFGVTVRREGEHAAVAVTGELDVRSRDTLIGAVAEVVERGARLVEVDLAQLTFCDSTGLSALLACVRITQARGGSARVVNPNPNVTTVLVVAGVFDRLTGGSD